MFLFLGLIKVDEGGEVEELRGRGVERVRR